MSLKIGPEFERVEGQDTNSNVYKKKKGQNQSVLRDKIRIPMLPVDEKHKNSNVFNNSTRIPML